MIGDVLLTSVLAEILKQNLPNVKIDYLIEAHTYQAVENNPFIDQFIIIDKGGFHKFSKLIRKAFSLRKNNYDVVIDSYGKLSSNIITALSGAKVKIAKYKWYSQFIYHYNIPYKPPKQLVLGLQHYHRIQLLNPLCFANNTVFPKIYLTSQEIEKAKEAIQEKRLSKNKAFVMASLLGSSYLKSYPKEYMASVLEHIVKKTDCFLLFNYIPSQEKEAFEIFDLCSTEVQSRFVLDLHQKGLREFIAILSQCKAIIGNEGGAINMAKALGIPSFSIFSPQQDKAHWNHMEESAKHVSVHLKEYKPELCDFSKKIKTPELIAQLYSHFTPDLFIDKLNFFLEDSIKPKKN